MRAPLAHLTTFPRAVVLGVIVGAVCGGVAGLVVGLRAYPPTAPFAVFELEVPGAVAGLLGGLLFATLVTTARWVRDRSGIVSASRRQDDGAARR